MTSTADTPVALVVVDGTSTAWVWAPPDALLNAVMSTSWLWEPALAVLFPEVVRWPSRPPGQD